MRNSETHDETGLRELYEHEDFVRRLARGILGNDAQVDDVIQETYVAAWQRKWRTRDNLRSWLGTVARNFALMRIRSHERRRRHEEQTRWTVMAAAAPDEVLAAEETKQLIARGVASLPEPFREVLRLRYYDDLSFARIATQLGVSRETARLRVGQAMQQLVASTGVQRDSPRWRRSLAVLALVAGPRTRRSVPAVTSTLAIVGVFLVALGSLVFLMHSDAEESGAPRTLSSAPRPSAQTVRPAETTEPAPVDADPNRIAGPDLVVRGVVWADGRPAAGARVSVRRAYERPEDPDTPHAPPVATVRASDDGSFLFRLSRRTRLTVQVEHRAFATASVLVVAPPEGDPADVGIHMRPATPTRGYVFDPETGRPVAGAVIRARQGSGIVAPVEHVTRSNRRGEFVLPLREPDVLAPLTVTVAAKGYCELYRELRPVALVDPGVELRHEFALRRGAALRGRVVDSKDQPVANAVVTVEVGAGYRATTNTDHDGRYVARNLPRQPVIHIEVIPLPATGLTAWRGPPARGLALPATYDLTLPSGTTVEGTTRTGDFVPVPAARVELFRRDGKIRRLVARTESDDRGQFRFERVPEGEFAIEATAPNLGRFVRKRLDPDKPFPIDFIVHDSAQRPPHQEVVLEPCGKLLVRLDIPKGVIAPNSRSSEEQSLIWVGVEINYVLFEGRAEPGRIVSFEHVPVTSSGLAFGPGGDPVLGPFDTKAGATTEITLASPEYAATIDVMVVDAQGRPVTDAAVGLFGATTSVAVQRLVEQRYSLPHYVQRTGRDGMCRIRLVSQHAAQAAKGWMVVASHAGYPLARTTGTKLPRETVRVQLQPGLEISGRVKGAPAPVFWLRKADGKRATWRLGAQCAENGEFTLTGLEPGVYQLRADDGAITEATAGKTGVVLEARARRIALGGLVVDEADRPVRGALIRVGSRSATTNAGGAWRLRVDEGKHEVSVEPSRTDAHFAPVRGEFESGRTDLRFEVRADPGVSGAVLTPAGQPLAGAVVIAHAPRKDAPLYHRITGADGTFRFPGLAPEYTDLLIVAKGRRPSVRHVEGARSELRIALDTGLSVHGVLRLSDNRPAGAVQLTLVPFGRAREFVQRVTARTGELRALVEAKLAWRVRTDQSGRFRFIGLPEEEFALLSKSGFGDEILTPHHVRAGDAEVMCQMTVKRTVNGRIDFSRLAMPPRPRALAFWGVHAYCDGVHVGLAAVRPDGTYVFKRLPQRPLRLEFYAAGSNAAAISVPANGEPKDFEVR